jgi:hypothetical protein
MHARGLGRDDAVEAVQGSPANRDPYEATAWSDLTASDVDALLDQALPR